MYVCAEIQEVLFIWVWLASITLCLQLQLLWGRSAPATQCSLTELGIGTYIMHLIFLSVALFLHASVSWRGAPTFCLQMSPIGWPLSLWVFMYSIDTRQNAISHEGKDSSRITCEHYVNMISCFSIILPAVHHHSVTLQMSLCTYIYIQETEKQVKNCTIYMPTEMFKSTRGTICLCCIFLWSWNRISKSTKCWSDGDVYVKWYSEVNAANSDSNPTEYCHQCCHCMAIMWEWWSC